MLESTTYPGTTRERLQPILERVGARRRPRLPPRLLAGADRPRPHRLHRAHHAEAGRRHHAGLRRAGARALRADLRRGRRPLDPGGGGAGEAAGEHLPLGQHRPGQRALPALRPARDRRLGGDRSGRRPSPSASCASTPGPGMGGHCLPVDPFYLAFKAREHDFYPEFIELAGKVNRAQPGLLRRPHRARPQRGRKGGQGLRSCCSASATRPGSATSASRRRWRSSACCASSAPMVSYHDPFAPELAELDLRSVDLDEAPALRRPGGDRHRAPGDRLRRGGRRRRR